MKFRLAIGSFLVALLVGCGGGGGGRSTANDPDIRFVNASPDSTSIQTEYDFETFGPALSYLSASPGFAIFEPKDSDLSIREAASVEALDTISFVPERTKSYIMLTLGLRDFGDEFAKRIRPRPFAIDRSLPNGTKARVIFVNCFCEEPGFSNPNVDFQDGDRAKFKFSDVGFTNISTQLLDVGTYSFQARRAGSELVYASADLTFEAGKIYLALFTGIRNAAGDRQPKIVTYELPVKPNN